MNDAMQLIDLFPLELVVLPGEAVPLHIFEERYKRLTTRCRTDGAEFGVVLAEEDRVHECGCSVALTAVLEEFDDGRSNVLVEGRRRFRILRLFEPEDEADECLRAQAEFFDDVSFEVSTSVRESAIAAYTELLGFVGIDTPHIPAGSGPLSFRMGAAVNLGAPVKQALLESTSESERLVELTAVMRTLLPRLRMQRERADAIRGNGKGM